MVRFTWVNGFGRKKKAVSMRVTDDIVILPLLQLFFPVFSLQSSFFFLFISVLFCQWILGLSYSTVFNGSGDLRKGDEYLASVYEYPSYKWR